VQAPVPKQTLVALLSAIETDVRALIVEYLAPCGETKAILGEKAYEVAVGRLVRDTGPAEEPTTSSLANYLDFQEAWDLLNAHRQALPASLASFLAANTREFQALSEIRNRVMHARSLVFDDLAKASAIVDSFRRESPIKWPSLLQVRQQLDRDPGSVLGMAIPRGESDGELSHNLPTPDFDETGFVGRSDLVTAVIDLCLGPYPVVTIKGEGGLGKSALALRAAYDMLAKPAQPFDTIVWASSKTTQITPNEIKKIEGAITDSLGLIGAVASELTGQQVTDPVSEVLEYLQEFNVLLILDNLETVLDDRVRSFVEQVPQGSKLLLTSRIGLGAYEYPVELGPLTGGEAGQFARELAKARSGTTKTGSHVGGRTRARNDGQRKAG